jgi:hypothetical protein
MTRARGTIPLDDEQTSDQIVHAFAEECRSFIALISSRAPTQPAERARCLAYACAALYASASALEDLGPTLAHDADAPAEVEDDGGEVADEGAEVAADWTLIGAEATYQVFVDPFCDGAPALASLRDDLEEIIAELAVGLAIHDDDPSRWRDAALEWRTGFVATWGRHLASLMYAAHCALAAHRTDG